MKNILLILVLFFGLTYLSIATENLYNTPWSYILQDININEIVNNNTFELIVMDYSADGTESGEFGWEQIDSIQVSGKYAISYISIGEAENYRFYWNPVWETNPPSWLGPENPDWEGNYKVRFWESEWQNIIFSYLDRIIEQGFDGIYMDIIDAYYYWMDENPEQPLADSLMVEFVHNIRNYIDTQTGRDDFYLIPQNGEQIIIEANVLETLKQQYFNDISAIGIEDIFFYGDDDNNNPYNPEQYRIDVLTEFLNAGIPVFSVEYLTQQSLIDTYLSAANDQSYVPYVSIRDLNILNNGMFIDSPELNIFYENQNMMLVWDEIIGAGYYFIYCSEDPYFDPDVSNYLDSTAVLNYEFTPVSEKYFYLVKALRD
ncbi:MAG TPA: hypothetical protein ENL20_05415 [Candidatus Cloacimonetes bacterium]|nr:hypothetical protein [Candidatus Cloacimonadota bacterium]